jgi:23S rRNA-/tRNA-specific pseudouridylate synthase
MKKLPRKARSSTGKPDRVSVPEDRRRPRFSQELSVLYEDDAVVVLDKPAGLLAVPAKGSDTPSASAMGLKSTGSLPLTCGCRTTTDTKRFA